MFSFLNTSILTGLLAVSIPLLIHLLTRKKVKKIDFSTLYFLKELKTQKIRRLKIRQILLMIIRTIIVLFLILGFARPTMKGAMAPTMGEKAKTAAVFIVDNSMSMQTMVMGRQLFDSVQDHIYQLATAFQTGDELYAIAVTPGAPDIYRGARYQFKQLIDALRKTDVSGQSTDIPAALEKARDILLQSKNVNKEIFLLSDFQKSGFMTVPDDSTAVFQDIPVHVFAVPIRADELSNLAITGLEFQNQIIERGKVVEMDVIVANTGRVNESGKLLQLFIDGKRTAQTNVQLKAGEKQRVTFHIIPEQTGLISGYVMLDDDDLLADNRHYFVFYVPEKVDMLLVGENSGDTHFLKIATKVQPNIDATEVQADRLVSGIFNNRDVVILANVRQLSAAMQEELIQFVQNGGGLIISLGPNVDIETYNKWLCKPFSLPYYVRVLGDDKKKDSYVSLGKLDFSHPVFKGMFNQKPELLDSPRFFTIAEFADVTSARTIARFSNRVPFLMEAKFANGRILVMNTALNGYWSDINLKAIFVPLLNRSVLYLSGATERMDRQRIVGDELKTVLVSETELKDLRVIKPDRSEHRIRPGIQNSRYTISFHDVNMAGMYLLQSGDTVLDMWAVNPEPGESDLTQLEMNEFRQYAGEDRIIMLDESKPLADQILSTRYGRELWKVAIAIVLVLLIIESLLAREGRVQQSNVQLKSREAA